MNDIDWTRLRLEYVTKGRTLHQLAEANGMHKTTIARRSKAEGWEKQRQEYVNDTAKKCVQRSQATVLTAVDRLSASAYKLLDKCDTLLGMEDVIAPRDLKGIADTLLSVKQLLGIKDETEADRRIEVVWT